MSEKVLANHLTGYGCSIGQVANYPTPIGLCDMTAEELAKQKALNEQREKEYKQRAKIGVILNIAESLVVDRRVPVKDAFEIAKELYTTSEKFVEEFER